MSQDASSSDPTDLLAEVLAADGGAFVELRYHEKRVRSLAVEKGRVDRAHHAEHAGVGVRVLEQGTWGFASTARFEAPAIAAAIAQARRAARASSSVRRTRIAAPPPCALARGRFDGPGIGAYAERSIEANLDLVVRMEDRARAASPSIQSASCSYTEVYEEKGIVTTDGAKAWTRLVRPEFRWGRSRRAQISAARDRRVTGMGLFGRRSAEGSRECRVLAVDLPERAIRTVAARRSSLPRRSSAC